MLPEEVRESIEQRLDCDVATAHPVGGGCINECAIVRTNKGSYFAKWNDAHAFPGMFEAEERGLSLMSSTKTVKVPAVYFTESSNALSWIVMQALETGGRRKNFWEEFGRSLARLHRHTSNTFGLDHDNYIGSLPQANTPATTWSEFFADHRLQPQFRTAVDNGRLSGELGSHLDRLCARLTEMFPNEPPALLHGDLWNGNFITGPDGHAWLIDPAVYYGHREMDLGMTRLFGGFDERFHDAYHEEFPLGESWEARVEVCNLYPLLVHVNLFGGGYAGSVEAGLRRY